MPKRPENLLLSLAVHAFALGALVVATRGAGPDVEASRAEGPVSVSLGESAPAPRGARRSDSVPIEAPARAQSELAPTVAGAANAALEYRQALRAAIEARKNYPAAARARREQGRVEVGFTLGIDGAITDVHLASPSPYALLNGAALESVRRVGRFRPFPAGLSSIPWRVTVPLVFKTE